MNSNMNRETICETALKLFKEKGYDKVTVQEICDVCCISKPTFYHYISSKEDLILTFYDDITKQLTEKLTSIIDANNHWEQFLICFEVLMEESMRVGSDIGSQMFIMNLKKDHHSFDRRTYLTNIMITIIKKGQQTGQIQNPSSAEILYEAAAYTFTGYEVMWCIRKENLKWKQRMFCSFESMFHVREDLRKYS